MSVLSMECNELCATEDNISSSLGANKDTKTEYPRKTYLLGHILKRLNTCCYYVQNMTSLQGRF